MNKENKVCLTFTFYIFSPANLIVKRMNVQGLVHSKFSVPAKQHTVDIRAKVKSSLVKELKIFQ